MDLKAGAEGKNKRKMTMVMNLRHRKKEIAARKGGRLI